MTRTDSLSAKTLELITQFVKYYLDWQECRSQYSSALAKLHGCLASLVAATPIDTQFTRRIILKAPSAALEKFLAGQEAWASKAQSSLAASIDAHLENLDTSRCGCAVELGNMRTVMDHFEGVLEDELGSTTAYSCHSIDLQRRSAKSSAAHCGEQDGEAARTDLLDNRVDATGAADQSLLLASVIDALEAESQLMDDVSSNVGLTTPLDDLETWVTLATLQPYLSETSIERLQAFQV